MIIIVKVMVAVTDTLSGRIGKVVASHAEVARSIPGCAETAPIHTMQCARGAQEVLPMRVGRRPVNLIYRL